MVAHGGVPDPNGPTTIRASVPQDREIVGFRPDSVVVASRWHPRGRRNGYVRCHSDCSRLLYLAPASRYSRGEGVLRHVRIVAGSQFWRRSASCRSSHDPRSPCQCDHAVDLLSATAIVALLVLCGWLSLRLHGANRDIRELRTRVESLKRQILPLR